ncbi:hypothetical protein GGR54DRAFT_600457 [Hypoxylon sp. NC1633]|nr:hypothetical protein GGR54DRAFT_600457 [Hypoxylon sp. NC1633]
MDRDSLNAKRAPAAKSNGNVNGNGRGGKVSTQQPFGNRRVSKTTITNHEVKENHPDSRTGTITTSQHPLYSSPKYIPRANSFSASASETSQSPRETRIPLPTSTVHIPTSSINQSKKNHFQTQSLDMRKPMNLRSAYELARKQDTDGQLDNSFNIGQAFDMALDEKDRQIDGSPSPAPRFRPRRSTGSSNNDLGQRLQQFDRNHQLGTGGGPRNGLFGKARIGPKVSETANILAKKASNGSLTGSPARRRSSQWDSNPREEESTVATDLAVGPVTQGDAHKPIIPSIEFESPSDERLSPVSRPAHPSPEKSYNWHLDVDFTAQDLQVSDSPRIYTHQSFEEPARRPSSVTSSPGNDTPNFRRSNNRINQLRQKEIEAANAVPPEDDPSSSRRSNSRLEEVRAREMEALSKRAVATSRLDEIRIRNSESRSESPETGRSSNRDDLRGSSLLGHERTKTPEHKSVSGVKEDKGLDTPATVFRSTNNGHENGEPSEKTENHTTAEDDKKGTQLPRNDSHDLLRRLARATSNSPPTEKTNHQQDMSDDPPSKEKSESREDSQSRLTREERKPRNLEVKNLEVKSSRERPTVGFVGLRRVPSSDSIREKRSSHPGSEADPTDRIEAEMKLFAPLDNYSEKGSVRAPSPIPSEPAEEETPRPNKIDPLTQPTPRVTGAYVETPATTRVKPESRTDVKAASDDHNQVSDNSGLRKRVTSEPSNEDSVKQEENNETITSRRASIPRSSSVPTTSRRARSASRRRRPRRPVINTAKPPSVKDDIRTILRMNQIDDSTLEDFDSILADEEIKEEELEQMVNDTIHKIDSDSDAPGLSDWDRELQFYDKMSKSLKTGLLGIRSAKKGIERLEDTVSHPKQKAEQVPSDPKTSNPKTETHKPAIPSDVAAAQAYIPALYQKSPRFRLTKFGLLTLIATIWYILESVFCSLYAPQYNCTPDLPCDWSPHEPYFPYAMPFMLDEWATGGKGRALTWKIGEEMGDMFAEVSDWVTDTDFTQFDEKYMNVWERKRHRRRLTKHGLVRKWVAPPGYKPIFAEWNAARLAREAAEEAGYEEDDETMSADERVV